MYALQDKFQNDLTADIYEVGKEIDKCLESIEGKSKIYYLVDTKLKKWEEYLKVELEKYEKNSDYNYPNAE